MPSPADNQKSNFLVSGQRPYGGINDSTGAAEKNIMNFSKANTKFCLSLR